jgi:hypothetical protein
VKRIASTRFVVVVDDREAKKNTSSERGFICSSMAEGRESRYQADNEDRVVGRWL